MEQFFPTSWPNAEFVRYAFTDSGREENRPWNASRAQWIVCSIYIHTYASLWDLFACLNLYLVGEVVQSANGDSLLGRVTRRGIGLCQKGYDDLRIMVIVKSRKDNNNRLVKERENLRICFGSKRARLKKGFTMINTLVIHIQSGLYIVQRVAHSI